VSDFNKRPNPVKSKTCPSPSAITIASDQALAEALSVEMLGQTELEELGRRAQRLPVRTFPRRGAFGPSL